MVRALHESQKDGQGLQEPKPLPPPFLHPVRIIHHSLSVGGFIIALYLLLCAMSSINKLHV